MPRDCTDQPLLLPSVAQWLTHAMISAALLQSFLIGLLSDVATVPSSNAKLTESTLPLSSPVTVRQQA